jgi:hypothetical protein
MPSPQEHLVLTLATSRLKQARVDLQRGRPGASNPQEVVVALGRAQAHAERVWENIADKDSVPLSVFLELFKEIIRSAHQFLEYTQYMPRIPSPTAGVLFDRSASVRLRETIASAAESSLQLIEAQCRHSDVDLSLTDVIELQICVLTCRFHARPTDEGHGLWGDAKAILGTIDRHIADATPDPLQYLPWARVALLRMLAISNPGVYGRLILKISIDLKDRDVAWQILLAQLHFAADFNEPFACLSALESMIAEIKDLPTDRRRGMSVMAVAPIQYFAGVLIGKGDQISALRALQAYGSLSGQAAAVGDTLTTFMYGPSVFAVLHASGETFAMRAPIDEMTFTQFMGASEGALPKEVASYRKNLSRQLAPIVKDSRVVASPHLTLDPIGVTAWIPWHGLTSTGGRSFASAASLSWRHPAGQTEVRAHIETETLNDNTRSAELLIVDTSIRSSAEVKRIWLNAHNGDISSIFEFNSTITTTTAQEILQAVSGSRDCVFYGHATSDVYDPSVRGLLASPSELLVAEQIMSQSLNHVSSLLLIACEGGRSHPFEAASSPAHAFAMSGVKTVTATLWTIFAEDGRRYFERVMQRISTGPCEHSLTTWRVLNRQVDQVSLPFYCSTSDIIRPLA